MRDLESASFFFIAFVPPFHAGRILGKKHRFSSAASYSLGSADCADASIRGMAARAVQAPRRPSFFRQELFQRYAYMSAAAQSVKMLRALRLGQRPAAVLRRFRRADKAVIEHQII